MKLRNKKTGQEGNFIINKDHFECVDLDYVPEYRNLAKLNEEWEDVEEPKEHWFIDAGGEVEEVTYLTENDKSSLANFGNYFETKEEAEKAVEKLKAWKRLEDAGFRFTTYDLYSGSSVKDKTEGEFAIGAECSDFVDNKDLDLIFNEQEYIRKNAQKIVEDNADYYEKFGGEE